MAIVLAKNDKSSLTEEEVRETKLGKTVFAGVNIVKPNASDQGLQSDTNVFTGVNIVSLDTLAIYKNYSIFTENGLIERIVHDSLADYSGFKVYDMSGLFALPGLIDMHTHILDKSDLTQYLTYGVTTVRNMMGLPMHLRWKKQLKEGNIIGSDLISASPTLNSGKNKGPFHVGLKGTEKIEKLISKYNEKGYDFIKIYNGLTEAQFDRIMEVSRDLKIPVAGHPVNSVGRVDFLNSEVVSFEHIEEVFNTYMGRVIDDSLAVVIAKEFAEVGKPICITLSAYHHLFRTAIGGDEFRDSIPKEYISPLSRFIGRRQTSGYLNLEQKYVDNIKKKDAYLMKLTRLFYEQSVPLILGTDTGPNLTVPGATLHDEIALWQQAGIPNKQIIRAGTINAAKVLGLSDSTGQIKKGYKAEILFVKENPIKNISTLRNPAGIIHENQYFDRQSIKSLRELAKKKKTGWFISIGNLLEHLVFN